MSLSKLYQSHFGNTPEKIEELTSSSGSNRRYFRITDKGTSTIGVIGTSIEENKAFITIADHFNKKGIPAPKVICYSNDLQFYIQEDLGDSILFFETKEGRESSIFNEDEKQLLFDSISQLPKIQFKGAEDLDWSVCYPQPEFDKRMIAFDLNYFKYCFLKATGLEFNEIELEKDFDAMTKYLLEEKTDTFMYRDFQSRNVMIKDKAPYYIDFQGGRKGPIYYDVASFIWQAKANFSEELRDEILSHYLENLKQFQNVDEIAFKKRLRHFVLFRTLQVLGAYGFRGYFEKKPHFIQSIPFAINNLRKLLKEPFDQYPYLSEVLTNLTEMKQFSEQGEKQKLTVRIYSFSYKKGIPNDISGNGGGYVFDCRSVNNPGKFEHYRHFTGMDKEVIDFLEQDGEIFALLENAFSLVDKHVEVFIKRKFTHLMVSFGCTGGRHRSVYSAERMALHLSKKFDINVELFHREQEVEKRFY